MSTLIDGLPIEVETGLLGISGVYVYTMPLCLACPMNEQGDILLKVGHSEVCCWTRFRNQRCVTEAPQAMVLQRIYNTPQGLTARKLEEKFHNLLDAAFERSDGGREWWITNLEFLDTTADALGAPVKFTVEMALGTLLRPTPSRGIQLLWDIKSIFDVRDVEVIFTKDLLADLEVGRLRTTPALVGRTLRSYGIRPVMLRIGRGVARGYRREHFIPAWSQYPPVYSAGADEA
jgi:hypothetical protein